MVVWRLSAPSPRRARPHGTQLMNGSGVPEYQEQSAAINSSLAALPYPILDVTVAAQVQLQAMQAYYEATAFVDPANSTA